MSSSHSPSLGKTADRSHDQQETTPPNPTDGTDPINAETWQKAEAQKIAAKLNTASGFDHDRMTADFKNGLLAKPAREISPGVFEAESRLFISEWFDPNLDGTPGIVHGADFMYIIGKLVEQTSTSTIESVTEIRFGGIVKNEVDLVVSKDRTLNDKRKPVMTAQIHLKNGEDITITAYDKPDKPIIQRSASNTFAQHLCVEALTRHAAAIKWAQKIDKNFTTPPNFEIEINALPQSQEMAFDKFYTKNPSGFTASTALDIVITGTQVLAYLGLEAGGISELNALGAGFNNVTLPSAENLKKGCKLRLTVLKDQVRKTEKAEFWPIQFEFIALDTNQTLGQGIFNWVNRIISHF